MEPRPNIKNEFMYSQPVDGMTGNNGSTEYDDDSYADVT